jgi:hypothetical protein
MKTRAAAATAALLGLATVDQAFAGFFKFTPNPPPPVPEFDGSGVVAAVALLASVGALLFYRLRTR